MLRAARSCALTQPRGQGTGYYKKRPAPPAKQPARKRAALKRAACAPAPPLPFAPARELTCRRAFAQRPRGRRRAPAAQGWRLRPLRLLPPRRLPDQEDPPLPDAAALLELRDQEPPARRCAPPPAGCRVWTGPQPRPPLRPGDYNWVAERYLVSYHPPQGELNPDRAIEWVVGKSGALDASTAEPSRAESQREKFIPSALLAPPTAPPTAAPVRSRTRRARARPSARAHSPLCAANRRLRPTLRQRSASRATRCRW